MLKIYVWLLRWIFFIFFPFFFCFVFHKTTMHNSDILTIYKWVSVSATINNKQLNVERFEENTQGVLKSSWPSWPTKFWSINRTSEFIFWGGKRIFQHKLVYIVCPHRHAEILLYNNIRSNKYICFRMNIAIHIEIECNLNDDKDWFWGSNLNEAIIILLQFADS